MQEIFRAAEMPLQSVLNSVVNARWFSEPLIYLKHFLQFSNHFYTRQVFSNTNNVRDKHHKNL